VSAAARGNQVVALQGERELAYEILDVR